MIDLIAKKRTGGRHTPEEIAFIARGASEGSIPDYQLSAWLMAVCCRGMAEPETVGLTRAMAGSGVRLGLDALKVPKVDKHSTGGVGDGISLALAPLVASAGLAVPMMSGRGLGHTGGTLDKLESIAGVRVKLDLPEILEQLGKMGVSMFGQSEKLAPADRKLYHLRDATSTVESLPLIVASILSKKLAEDLDALVLDVKVGSGAIFRDPKPAEVLGKALVKTAKGLGLKCVAVLTSMDQPLGKYVVNALEIRQAVEVLQGDCTAGDYVEVLLTLGGWMVHLAGKAKTPEAGARLLEAHIHDGSALKRFKEMIAFQGGDTAGIDDFAKLPQAAHSKAVAAPKDGFIVRLDARMVGQAGVILGAGRSFMEQKLDYGAGMILDKKVGDAVSKGECVARLYANDPAKLEEAQAFYQKAFQVAARKPKPQKVIRKILR
jgi:pyrimidine-nucleoside phosphorylase